MRNKVAEKIVMDLLDELRKARLKKGFSHEKLAAVCGLNRSTISLIESKKRIPTILTCIKIANALELSLSELLESISKK